MGFPFATYSGGKMLRLRDCEFPFTAQFRVQPMRLGGGISTLLYELYHPLVFTIVHEGFRQ